MSRTARTLAVSLAAAGLVLASTPAFASGSFLGSLHKVRTVASTVPANGDVNPYGVAIVPRSVGLLHKGDVLVSNFNAKSNLQGTGTTIVQISPRGARTLFARISKSSLPGPCPGGIGLTTALVSLRSGWVIVGSLPTTNGMAATAKAGCLLVLNPRGKVAETFSGGAINGPWDATALDMGSTADLFVTNVLNGTVAAKGRLVNRGTVVRIGLQIPAVGLPKMISSTVIGSGFSERTDPAALVVGPTGVGLSHGTLFVADSTQNRIAAVPDALTRSESAFAGRDVSANGHLNTPLGLAIAPNGNVLTMNAGNGLIVETTPSGHQVATMSLDSSGHPPGSGALFGLAVRPNNMSVDFVDDATNTLRLLH